jgi:hypothetical protein
LQPYVANLFLTGPQAEGQVILEAVAVEAATVEATTTEPVVEQVTTTAPEPRVEIQVDPQPSSSTEVVVREAMVEDAAPLHSAPMSEAGASSHRGLELLDDELIGPAVVCPRTWSHGVARSSGSRYILSTLSSLAVMSTEY